jgi:hypothetical protein
MALATFLPYVFLARQAFITSQIIVWKWMGIGKGKTNILFTYSYGALVVVV